MSNFLNRISLPADSVIFNQNDDGDSAYIIEKGRVLIFLEKDGEEIPLVVLGEGEIFGELSLIDLQRRSASARTIEDCVLSMVNKSQLFERMYSADPVLSLVMRVLVSRIRQQNDKFLDHYRPTGDANRVQDISYQVQHLAQSRTAASKVLDAREGLDQIRLENDLYNAFHKNEFELFFQPIVNLNEGRIVGAETLLRWKSTEHGYVPPSDFIDFMETSAIVVPLGKWILKECFRCFQLLPKVSDDFQLSVNVSGKQFLNPLFLEDLKEIYQTEGVDPRHFKLEVTERVMMNGVIAQGILQACADLGFHLAIDDFGTGFSSLQFLSQMPVHSLKIDRSFTSQIITDSKVASVVRSLVSIAKELGLSITAEGIESEEELNCLKTMGVDVGQGFLYSKPVSFEDFCKMLPSKKIAV